METIAVVGAGALGRRMVLAFLRGGYRVILEDISPAALEQGIAWIRRSLEKDALEGTLAAGDLESVLARLGAASTAEAACREADLIVEAVADEEEMKVELFTIFDKFAKPGAIFASTTAKLSITELAEITVFPERCIGLRFLGAGAGSVRIQLERGEKTSEETLAACREVGERAGAKVLVSGPR